jgi:hypothetical protein
MAVALLLAALSAYAQGGGPPAPPAPRWQRVEARDGAFSVSMPGQPAYKTQTLTAKNGRPVEYATYTVDLGRSAYMVSTSDYDNQTRISLDGAIDGVLSSWKDPLVLSRDKTTLYGYPGQIVDLTSEKYRVTVRAFAVGKRLYQLGFVELIDDYAPEHRNRFMSSFTLR